MMTRLAPRGLAALLALIAAACRPAGEGDARAAKPASAAGAARATTLVDPPGWNAAAWRPPGLDSLPDDSLGRAIRRGHALVVHTRDSLPAYVGGNLNCTSCHLDEGRRVGASPLTGVFARYPRYVARVGAVIPIEDRVNYCFTRSLAGTRLPADSREMQDIVAYLAFLSRGVPVGAGMPDEGIPTIGRLVGDTARGRALFAATCARCHGADGQGMPPAFPALWGPRSFSIGASMAREERAASFIRRNMPFDAPGTLTDQQAFDIAAFVVSHPRPDLPGKERDWPAGGAPPDVPYDTPGHRAYNPPRLLPRRNPAGALVPAPAPVSSPTRAP